MKKILALIVPGFALIFNLTACKPNGNNNSTDAESNLGQGAIDTVNVNRIDTTDILPIGKDSSQK